MIASRDSQLGATLGFPPDLPSSRAFHRKCPMSRAGSRGRHPELAYPGVSPFRIERVSVVDKIEGVAVQRS